MTMQKLTVIALAAVVGGCGNAIDVDRYSAGTNDHYVHIVVNDRSLDWRNLEAIAHEAAAKKCGAMRVKVLRRAQTNVNVTLLTFRCEPSG
jgi:hypothetical protein